MGAEMRKARRTDIDVTVSLNQLGVNAADRIQNKADVHVVDISKGGIAFKSGYDFKVNSFYDTVITLANGEKLYVVVEILHRDSCENDEYMYGCRFVGIGAEDQFQIEAYQIVDTGVNIEGFTSDNLIHKLGCCAYIFFVWKYDRSTIYIRYLKMTIFISLTRYTVCLYIPRCAVA